MSCSTYSKENRKDKTEKNLKQYYINSSVPFYLYLSMIEHATSLQSLAKSSSHYSSHVLFHSQDNNVIWRHVCFNFINTNDSKVTGFIRRPDVMFAANLERFLFWLADERTKCGVYCERFLIKYRSSNRIRSDVRSYVCSIQPFSNRHGSNPVQNFWAVKIIRILHPLLISFPTFLFGDFFS